MHTIELDDLTYSKLLKLAQAKGLSVDSWIKATLAPEPLRGGIEGTDCAPLSRLNALEEFLDRMNVRSVAGVPWSSDAYYE